MSEPLSKLLHLETKPEFDEEPLTSDKNSFSHYPIQYNMGYNKCISDLDQLSPDVNKLAEIIKNFDADYVKEANFLAEEIINKMSEWIKR